MVGGGSYDMTTFQYNPRPGVQEYLPNEKQHRENIARVLNGVAIGAIDCTLQVTLDANAASTTVVDSRISIQTAPILVPTTAHAAAEVAAGGLYVTPTKGQVVINHANNAQTDRIFQLALLG